MAESVFLLAVALFGACIGSFLNVVIYRVPLKTFTSGGKRSHCRDCGYQIQWFDNIPVISWTLLLRGKCRRCGAKISARYPLVEVLTAALLVWVAHHTVGQDLPAPGSTAPWPSWELHWGPLLFFSWFVCILIACTFIDIDHRILPDVLTKPTVVVGIVGAVACKTVEGFGPGDAFDRGLYSAVGAACGYLLTDGIRRGATIAFNKPAMGYGDVKFMAAIGAFVGWDGTILTFFLGSMFGAIYGGLHKWITKEGEIYFGPFLALGALFSLFFKADAVTFVTVTWPAWLSRTAVPPWVTLLVALVSAALLFFLIRRGRRHS